MEDNNTKELKKSLRKEIAARTKTLDEEYCRAADKIIYNKVIALQEYERANTIFCFVSAFGEPNTVPLIEKALEDGKIVGVPKCISKEEMLVYKITSFEDLEPGMYGIMEPKEGLPVLEPGEIDFSLIPCVTCDLDGNRLGHGRGYYDRYLEKSNFTTCMICRGKLLSKDIPVSDHDIKPQYVISDYEK